MNDDQLNSLVNLQFPNDRAAPVVRPISPEMNKASFIRHLKKLAALQMEALLLYLALPEAQRFHECRAKYALAEGSNRSGKTNATTTELARALCGCDPYDKYERRNGVAMVVGLKEDNIALLWRKLGQPGAFKIVRDEHTRLWRAVRPDPNDPLHIDPYDLAYMEQWRDAPPLLPPRLVPRKKIAWDAASKGIPRRVPVPATGWRMEMRPSGSRPDQGDHFNVVLNDEEMEKSDWYSEEVRGLAGLQGETHTPRMIWSATSQVANPAFAELREKADARIEDYARFVFLVDNNPYVPDKEKRALFNALPEHERPTRYFGIPAASQRAIYGTYDPSGIHGCDPFELPLDWARYAIVDPGTGTCATLLAAVDPDESHVWIHGGFLLHNAEHQQWAAELKRHERGVRFEAVLMDETAAGAHNYNNPISTAEQFAEAMRETGITPRVTGRLSGFVPGTRDLKARTLALRNAMLLRPKESPFAGTPRLQVFRGCLPDLDKQIRHALSDLKDKEKRAKIDKQPCDLLDCLEYLAAYDPHYHEPEPVEESPEDAAIVRYRAKEEKRRQRRHVAGCYLG